MSCRKTISKINWQTWRDVGILFLLGLLLMPVPPNQTAATAIDIGTLTGYTAYTTTQDAWDGAATVQDLWYSYLPVDGDKGLEIYAYGTGALAYMPHTTVWTGPTASIAQLDNNSDSQSRPVQQDIVTFAVPGERIYFRFRNQGGNHNPSTLTLRIARWQNESITSGDLFINDSSSGWPGITMDPATAIPKRYELNYPAGEGQQVLRNGIVAVIDAFEAEGVVLYDVAPSGFTVRATPTMPSDDYTDALSTNQLDTFWALNQDEFATSFAVSIDQNGVVGTPLNLGFDSIDNLVPQADNSALYAVRGSEIKKITNPGGVGTTFLTVDATFGFAANLLMMTDDTLLVAYDKAATTNYIKRFNLSAVQQGSTITLAGVVGSSILERVFADSDDPNYFWIWWQTSTLNKFQKYRVSDGTLITTLSRMKFVNSVSETTDVTESTIYSGADFSCVPIVLRGLTPTTTTYPIRRMRRFMLPSSDSNYRMFLGTLELLMRTGVGLSAGDAADPPVLGSDPQVMMRISRDGGQTWDAERWESAGEQGRWNDRVRWLRNGSYRNGVLEITVSDPVSWEFIDMIAQSLKEGSS